MKGLLVAQFRGLFALQTCMNFQVKKNQHFGEVQNVDLRDSLGDLDLCSSTVSDKCNAGRDKYFITDNIACVIISSPGSLLCIAREHKSKERNMGKAKRTM